MAKQNSWNDCRRVRMSRIKPSSARLIPAKSQRTVRAPAVRPSRRKKLVVVRTAPGKSKYRIGRLYCAAGTRLSVKGTTTHGARRNRRSKMLSQSLFSRTPLKRINQIRTPAVAIFTPEGKRASLVFMAGAHSPCANDAAPYVAARKRAPAVKAISPQRFSLRSVAS